MGMQIDELISQSMAVLADCENNEFVKAWEDTVPIQQTAIDMLRKTGLRANVQGADPVKHAKLEDTWKKIAKTCEEKKALCPVETPTKKEKAKAKDEEEDPLDKLTVAELKEHAEKNSIDLGEATHKADILACIKKATPKASKSEAAAAKDSPEENPEVGKDGKIIGAIAELMKIFMQLLPLFFKP